MSPERDALENLRIDRNAPARRRFPVSALVVIVVFLLLAGGAVWWLTRPKAQPVRTLIVRESISSAQKTVLNASGYVTPRREATVSSKVTGKVVEVLVEEGMRVKDGQILARLDDTNVKANLQLAEAQLAAARSAQGETEARLDEASKELQRVRGLFAGKIATESDLDKALAEVNSLKARLERQQVEVTVAERQLALWQQQMEDLVIRAPFAGVVVAKNAQPGEMISPVSAGGGFTRTGICTIVDMDSLEIEVDVNESYINRVEPGQPVEATLDAYPDWKIPSKVIAIIPTADRQKATVKVRVGFEKLDSRILPQMGVKVAFRSASEVASASRAVAIPRGAVRREGDRNVVLVVHNGRTERRAVTLGGSSDDEVMVVAGLADGEKIVVSGATNLADGNRVKEDNP
jgi:RND family efflux transporter MFP subunit